MSCGGEGLGKQPTFSIYIWSKNGVSFFHMEIANYIYARHTLQGKLSNPKVYLSHFEATEPESESNLYNVEFKTFKYADIWLHTSS